MRYLWAAYRQGDVGDLPLEEGLDAAAFREAVEHLIVGSYDGAWTMQAETRRGFMPVGFVFAHWAGAGARWMIVDGLLWLPWASPRNMVESAVSFFRAIHHEVPMMGYAREGHKRMYEVCQAHGIMRRLGTSHNVFDEPAAIFETRALQ